MSLQVRLGDLITAIGTDIKLLRTYITGSSTGDLSGLTTTAKTSIIAAINEVKASATGSPPAATELVAGVAQVATQAETNAGTIDTDMVTPLKLKTFADAAYQPLDGDLTSIAALTTTVYGRAFLALANQAGLLGLFPAASETVASIIEIATQTETNTGTDDLRAITPLKLKTFADATYQPLDSDLTSIAAVATTAYGRAFLALANQAALLGLLPASSDTQVGVERNATQAEVNAGTLDTAAVTPLKFQTRLAAYALPLSYLDTDVNLAANSDTKVASQKAVKAYADARIAAADALQYKGVIDASTNPNYPASNAGDLYKISVAGKIGGASGPNVEVGDVILATTDGTAAGTQAAVGANWDIIQVNIDGAVTGPASSTSTDLATFNGTTGKVVQDSGVQISTDGTLATNNNTKVPTEGAIRTYLAATFYNKTELGNPETDLAAAYATAKA